MTSSPRFRMGLPTVPSRYVHIPSGSERVLLEAAGRFLLLQPDSIPLRVTEVLISTGLDLGSPLPIFTRRLFQPCEMIIDMSMECISFSVIQAKSSPPFRRETSWLIKLNKEREFKERQEKDGGGR